METLLLNYLKRYEGQYFKKVELYLIAGYCKEKYNRLLLGI